MSNKLVGIETRNQRKAKNINSETPEKRSSARLKTKNEPVDLNSSIEEEYTKQQNKKVKTEQNSEIKIALYAPPTFSKKLVADSIKFLKKYAADNDAL